jgi:hypothetical protein
MDQEMNFPNPVVRTDLPTRRSRWPRVLLAALGVGLLTLVFLPQILSSKVGRRFVVASIAGKTNMKVTIASFRTSWFGGTTINFLNMTDPAGRGIAAKSITTQASLWNLLRDRYKLGECVIDGAHFEYVVDDGRVSFPRFEASGPIANFKIRPAVDLSTTPNVLELSGGNGPGVIQVGVSKRVAHLALVYLNPFFREAVGGQGNGGVTLHVEQLRVPLAGKQWPRLLEAKGRMWAKSVMLDRKDEMMPTDALPDNLASQLALLTGDEQRTVPLDVDGPFAIAQGVVTHGPTATTVGDTTLMIQGTTELDGDAIKATASVVRSPSITSRMQSSGPVNLAMPLGGTIRKPQLGVSQMRGDLPEAPAKALAQRMAEQVVRMRAKETQRQMEKSQNQVQDILRPLQPPPGTPTPATPQQ